MLVYERQPLATLLHLIPQSLHRLHPLNLLLNQATCPAEFVTSLRGSEAVYAMHC